MNEVESLALIAAALVIVGFAIIWWPRPPVRIRAWYHDSSGSAPVWLWDRACEKSEELSRSRRGFN